MRKSNIVKGNHKTKDSLKLEDIKELGGNEEDYELIQSDSADDNDSVELNGDSTDSEDLKNEVATFINKLNFGKKRKNKDDSDGPDKVTKKLRNAETSETAKQAESKAVKDAMSKKHIVTETIVQHNSTGKTLHRTPAKAVKAIDFTMKSRKYLLIKEGNWMNNQFPDGNVESEPLPKESMEQLEEFAKKLLDAEVALYRSQQDRKKSSSWMRKVLASGTAADKMAALVVLVQDSPVHNLSNLEHLISMLKMKERRKSLVILESTKKLFLTSLLTDQKLKSFAQQPLGQAMELASGNKDTQDKRLIMWYFESQLKEKYESFIKAVEILSHDTVEVVKSKSVAAIFDMLCEKPEQEKVLLSMLVNKLGDPVRKMAARSAHLLSKLVERHPKMKMIVTVEVERLLYRANITAKAQYYAICFLNGLRLSKSDAELASRLVMIYFSFFKAFVAKGEVDSKMLSGLLAGVNRAYPFAKVDQQKISEQYETLFRLIHVSNFGTSIQALMLLFQIVDVTDNSSDRYYMAVYRKLLDAELPSSSKLPLFLNLLLKSMKKDPVVARIQAFIKRLLQVAMTFMPALACSALLVLSEVVKVRPDILSLTKTAEESDDDEEEHFVDVKEENDSCDEGQEAKADVTDSKSSKNTTPVAPSWIHRQNFTAKKDRYDPLHRNPLYCRADRDCIWELRNLVCHYHPSVQVFAKKLLQGESIDYSSNPLEDFSLQRFLDRFVVRNPKKKSADPDEGDQSDGGESQKSSDEEFTEDDDDDIDDSDFDDAIDEFEAHVDEDF